MTLLRSRGNGQLAGGLEVYFIFLRRFLQKVVGGGEGIVILIHIFVLCHSFRTHSRSWCALWYSRVSRVVLVIRVSRYSESD